MDKEEERQEIIINPALKELAILVGEWKTKGFHPMLPSPVQGHASFGWLEEGAFFYWRSSYEKPGPPNGIALIGRDDTTGNYDMLYFDERGVSRIYQMSLEGKIWKYWRNAPGFLQRTTCQISADLKTIVAHGEKSSDGVSWEQDLDLTYTRIE